MHLRLDVGTAHMNIGFTGAAGRLEIEYNQHLH